MRERLVIELPDLHSFHSLIGGSNPAHNHEIRPADADLISWLGRRFLNRTFSIQDDDQIVDVEEIRELLDEETKEADDE